MRLAQITSPARNPDYPLFILPESVDGYVRGDSRATASIVEGRCGYDIGAGWHPARCGNLEPCPEHGGLTCAKCGGPALFACSFAGGSFVCGKPVCETHQHNCGGWGH